MVSLGDSTAPELNWGGGAAGGKVHYCLSCLHYGRPLILFPYSTNMCRSFTPASSWEEEESKT